MHSVVIVIAMGSVFPRRAVSSSSAARSARLARGIKPLWIQPFVVVVEPQVQWRRIFGSVVQLTLMRCDWLQVARGGWRVPSDEQVRYASEWLLRHLGSWPPSLPRSVHFLHLIWRRFERRLHGPIDRVHNWVLRLLRSIDRSRSLR